MCACACVLCVVYAKEGKKAAQEQLLLSGRLCNYTESLYVLRSESDFRISGTLITL